MADAWVDLDALRKRTDAGEVTSGDMFGTREVKYDRPEGRVSEVEARAAQERKETAPTHAD